MSKKPRITVLAEDLVDLIDEWDSWAGCKPPEEAELHRQRFKDLRARAEAAMERSSEGEPS